MEGSSRFGNRLTAWRDHNKPKHPHQIAVMPSAINLNSSPQDVRNVTEFCKENDIRIVVVDTLSRSLVGAQDSDAEAMSKLLDHCDQMRKELDGCIILVHHSGKDEAKGSRGWSGLRGAIDTEIVVEKDGETRTMRVTKQRDDKDDVEVNFKLKQVEMGISEKFAVPITTCVVVPLEEGEAPKPAKPKPSGAAQVKLMMLFKQYRSDHGKPNPSGTHMPEAGAFMAVKLEDFVASAAEGWLSGDVISQKKRNVRSAIQTAEAKGYLCSAGGWLWDPTKPAKGS